MKKLLIAIAFIFAIGIFPNQTYAAEVARPSAQLARIEAKSDSVDRLNIVRIQALKNVFKKYNSPLVEYASAYVKYAGEYDVDWKLLPAISGLESSFGVYLMPGSYNAYGWGGGMIYFESWENGIKTINAALRQNYINRGATDVWSIGPIYAESPTWAVRVDRFMNEINEEYLKLSTFSAIPNI